VTFDWASQSIVVIEQTIRSFLAEAITYVISQNYKSIAFPAIGCGRFGLNANFIAETMINHIKMEKCSLSVTFAIHPKSHDVFDTFQNVNGNNTTIFYNFVELFSEVHKEK
jgi:O-acetyl-ADP-ribose deacetylase (regulator of RNase III)